MAITATCKYHPVTCETRSRNHHQVAQRGPLALLPNKAGIVTFSLVNEDEIK